MKSKIFKTLQRPVRMLMDPVYVEDDVFRADSARWLRHTEAQAKRLEERLAELTGSVLHSRWIQTPDSLFSRNEVGHWLNWLGLVGDGVEIGVFRGEFSSQLLDTWGCDTLSSVDPWHEFPSDEYVDTCNVSQEKQDQNFKETQARLARFGARSRIMRKTGEEACAEFFPASLDFVYLDAQHHYEAVRRDIEMWQSKVKPGGILGGHDYLDGTIASGIYGVKTAVDEFAKAHGLDVIVTREPRWRSWFVRVA